MKRSNTEKINEVVRRFMKANRIEKPYMEYKAIASWSDIMGASIASRTTRLYFKQSTLFIHINSSVLRHELFLRREEIQRTINEHLNYQVVKNIMIQ